MKPKNAIFLFIATLFWGISFSAQSAGGKILGAMSFNFVRFVIGSLVLIPIILIMDKAGISQKPVTKADKKRTWLAGSICGVALVFAANLQQLGINLGTPSGKAGFLTACYIVIVPIMGIFLKKRCNWNVWLGVAITVVGLYFLCMDGAFTIQLSDLLVILCAFMFAVHILAIDHFIDTVDGVRMSCIQFITAGILTGILATVFEIKPWEGNFINWAGNLTNQTVIITILYSSIFVVGIAYTFQILGQKDANPTIASLIMSLESVISVISGMILLHETLTPRAIIGCVLLFSAVILAQIPFEKFAAKKKK